MTDTGKTILWIAVAIVVIAVIIWLFVSAGRRRELEARRFEAGELRARVEQRLPQVQGAEDRASVTAAVAAEARAQAEQQNAVAERQAEQARRQAAEAQRQSDEARRRAEEAQRLEQQAHEHRAAAEAARREHASLQRQADRVDPDIDTDDDEEDLADAENPFAPPVTVSPAAGSDDEVADDDAAGADPLGTGTARELHPDERSTTVSDTPHADTSDTSDNADTAEALSGTDTPGDSVTPPPATVDEPHQVEVPALADRGDVIADGGTPASDPGDHRGQPWATTPGAPGPGDSEEPADEGIDVDMAPHSHASDDTDEPDEAVAPEPEPRREDAEPAPDLTSAAFPEEDATSEPQPTGRRTSGFDEVVDGGFGIGSAAPIADGAQPLGHAVKGTLEGRTFVGPDDAGYDDVEPDVWFYNEEAARRAGFRRQGE